MRHEGNGQPVVYKVIVSEKHRALINETYNQYVQDGKRDFFLAKLRLLYDKLRHEPTVFGEPLYRLKIPDVFVRQGVIAPLGVVYGVNEEHSAVIVRKLTVLT